MKNGKPMFTLLLVVIISLVATAYGGWRLQVTSLKNLEVAIHDVFSSGEPAVVDVATDGSVEFSASVSEFARS